MRFAREHVELPGVQPFRSMHAALQPQALLRKALCAIEGLDAVLCRLAMRRLPRPHVPAAKKSPAQGRASSGGNRQEQESPKLADSIHPKIGNDL